MLKKYHYLEAFFSIFIVGMGQILKGEGKKGLLLLLLFYLTLPAIVYASLFINAFLFVSILAIAIIAGIALWGYGIVDALLKNE
jgi:hypothetical protein